MSEEPKPNQAKTLQGDWVSIPNAIEAAIREPDRRILDLEKQVTELRAATKEAGYIADYVAKFEVLLNRSNDGL